ncbi:citrate synthase/methylcitrate synthase [Devosia nitrariae]|uniref:Citrate synthase n=1 Tax=Devosia nitrariae TaxID=2071872 RepID=A0ABQ5W5P4_9HYPH|nr:citrate synthase/methylcitrate synthase [Devosia nitrariae]GLQ55287.1 citrate synthase/methylcitrate synthase [Devosia nitrariae]
MKSGLEDVVAAETRLSDVDGAAGRLVIGGLPLDKLVAEYRFEDAASLLLGRFFGNQAIDEAALAAARAEAFVHVDALDDLLLAMPPVDAMRVLLGRLQDGEDVASALRLLAGPAVFLPAILRRQRGEAAIAPDPGLRHSPDILYMLRGERPSEEHAAALDGYLVMVCDHGLNASTFASRVIASTGAGLASSALAALSALKGPLHGGAPGPVLDMLDAIGQPENARDWLTAELDEGRRLMGFGHRIYRVRDPRADALKSVLERLTATGQVDKARIELAEAVETAALRLLAERKPDRPLLTNVDYYTVLLLEALGFPREAFTGLFAIGRMAGWLAHAREQATDGRLIRPQSRYIGPVPEAA